MVQEILKLCFVFIIASRLFSMVCIFAFKLNYLVVVFQCWVVVCSLYFECMKWRKCMGIWGNGIGKFGCAWGAWVTKVLLICVTNKEGCVLVGWLLTKPKSLSFCFLKKKKQRIKNFETLFTLRGIRDLWKVTREGETRETQINSQNVKATAKENSKWLTFFFFSRLCLALLAPHFWHFPLLHDSYGPRHALSLIGSTWNNGGKTAKESLC